MISSVDLAAGADRRVAGIGDVAGHLDELRGELRRLGAYGPDLRLPDDLTVVQVGDLVHRGPDSDGVIALVDRYLSDQPDQWVQLVGNHEAQYLRTPAFDWSEPLADVTIDALRRWWADGQLQAAVAIITRQERFLVTHAGLTAGFWRVVLDCLVDPTQVAAALNSFIGSHEDVLFAAGQMLGRRRPAPLVGPIWAAAGTELLPSWLGSSLPFSQLHGHTGVFDWQRDEFRTSAAIVQLTVLDREAKHATTTLRDGRIIGVDPGHGEQARRPWRAWEVSS